MKSVRVWFTKEGQARYISHLDLNRVMLRAIHQSKLPVWYTEGYNQHPFITFALPLSLGFIGKRESMDLRLLDDSFSADRMIVVLNNVLPEGIHVFAVTQPVMKSGDIAFADFTVFIAGTGFSSQALVEKFHQFLALPEILVNKKTKSGIKEIDLKPFLTQYTAAPFEEGIHLQIRLPAGSTGNLNPALMLGAFENHCKTELFYRITRQDLYNRDGERFV